MIPCQLNISGNAPDQYPTEIFFGLLETEEGIIYEIPKCFPFKGRWGVNQSLILREENHSSTPCSIDIVWLSIVERKFYSVEAKLDSNAINTFFKNQDETVKIANLVVGMAPEGFLAIWIQDYKKSALINWIKANEVNVNINDFLFREQNTTIEEYCTSKLKEEHSLKENLRTCGYSFEKNMQQFNYRYLLQFASSDIKNSMIKNSEDTSYQLIYIEETLFDGTYNKVHKEDLLKYHTAGKPQKLALKWSHEKDEFDTYFWLKEDIQTIFNKFYGAHRDTKVEFIILIDPVNTKYELALYRSGLKEPVHIPKSIFQVIVFKNKFECFRSENYIQERGAWIW